jgi:diguanylate cyclase (GGDEF)-like protein/PAS domain S-box-containing protein
MDSNRSKPVILDDRIQRVALHHAFDAVIITSADLELPGPEIIYVNPAFCQMTGYEPHEVIGKTPRILQGPRTSRAVLHQLKSHLIRGLPFEGETWNYRKDGSEYIVHWRIDPVRGDHEQITHWVSIQRDVTTERQLRDALDSAYRRLDALTHLDQLTGIFNRSWFDLQIRDELERSINGRHPLGLILIDIDHFKSYNDHYGQDCGNQCLQQVAWAIERSLRRAGDAVARYGGEELAVLLPGADTRTAAEIAERLRLTVERLGIPHDGKTSQKITVSIGVAAYEDGVAEPFDLITRADEALERAKRRGRDRVEVARPMDYSPPQNTPHVEPR